MEGVLTTAQMSSLDSLVAVAMDIDWTLTTEDVLVSLPYRLTGNETMYLSRYTILIFASPDIDECQSSPCGELCTNTNGSYYCHCTAHLRLADDGVTCICKSVIIL